MVKAFVLLQSPDAQDHDIIPPDASREANASCVGAGGESVEPAQVERVRNDTNPIVLDAKVLSHDWFQRPVGRDDAVSGLGAREDGTSQRQVPRALQPGTARIGRAELLEALRVEDERR